MRIVIWTGPAWETWGSESLKTGIGGSELAAIHMASGLANLGHDVEIVGQVIPCKWQGVTFTDYGEYRLLDPERCEATRTVECDVFVSSRSLPALRLLKPKCRLSALWMHDIHVGHDPQGLLGEYDIILNPSEWARETARRYYPTVPEEKFIVTRNGIDTGLFKGTPVKDGCKAIYSSSPDRGLDKLLDYWPAIRKMRPDAELHVYYGFDTWERMAELRKDRIAKLQIEIFRTRLTRMEEQGVVSHGRVGQEELAKAWMGASLWPYPTSFSETSCCHPDTLISIPGDHRIAQPFRVRISELAGKTNFPVYTYDQKEDRFRIGTALWCAQTKIAEELVEISLDDGSTLRLTPEQLVMTFSDQWVEAGNLQPGDRLLALHHRYAVMIKDTTGRWIEESRLVGEWLANQQGFSLTHDLHVDHLDPLRLNNFPEKLQILSSKDHFKKTHTGKIQRHSMSLKKAEASRRWISENLETVTAKLKLNGEKLWRTVNSLSPEDRVDWCQRRNDRKKIMMRLRSFFPDFKERIRELAIRHAKQNQNLGRGLWDWMALLPDELRRSIIEDTHEGKWNHRVVSIRRISGGPVFDMEVADHHNFIADGVVIHNCITAMEAQAAGAWPITSSLAALKETVRHGILIDPPNTRDGYREEFLGHVRSFLDLNEAFKAVSLSVGRDWAMQELDWSGVAVQWEKLFMSRLEG